MSSWSENPPTKPGRYFWKPLETMMADVVQVFETEWGLVVYADVHGIVYAQPIKGLPGEWWPERIEPPSGSVC